MFLSTSFYIMLSVIWVFIVFYINKNIKFRDGLIGTIIGIGYFVLYAIVGSFFYGFFEKGESFFNLTIEVTTYNRSISFIMMFFTVFSVKLSNHDYKWQTKLWGLFYYIILLGVAFITIVIFDYITGTDNSLLNTLFPYKSVMEDLPE